MIKIDSQIEKPQFNKVLIVVIVILSLLIIVGFGRYFVYHELLNKDVEMED